MTDAEIIYWIYQTSGESIQNTLEKQWDQFLHHHRGKSQKSTGFEVFKGNSQEAKTAEPQSEG